MPSVVDRLRRLEPQTVYKKSMKTKGSSCQRILRNLKVFVSKWYRKLPNPSLCCCRNHKQDHLFYENILSVLSESDRDSFNGSMDKKRLLIRRKEPLRDEDIGENNGSFLKFLKASPLKKGNNGNQRLLESKRVTVQNVWSSDQSPYSKQESPASFLLEQRMRELMMDMDDLEQVLDIEEVLHYYSRLNTPVYIDIVDRFFTHICTDMYSLESSCESEF